MPLVLAPTPTAPVDHSTSKVPFPAGRASQLDLAVERGEGFALHARNSRPRINRPASVAP